MKVLRISRAGAGCLGEQAAVLDVGWAWVRATRKTRDPVLAGLDSHMERAAKPAHAIRLMVGMIDREFATNAATGVCAGQGGRDMRSRPQAMMRALAP